MQEYIASRTRVAYAYDIRVFFEYLHDNNPIYGKKDIKEYTIDNTDYQKTVYYTCKAESPAVNPKTGNALIFVAWVVGLSSLGYSIYWFKKNKKEEV